MLSSSIRMKSQLDKVLANPEALKKDIAVLIAQEKKTKAAQKALLGVQKLKDLQESASKCEALANEKEAQAKKILEKSEQEAADLVLKAEASIAEAKAKAEAKSKKAKETEAKYSSLLLELQKQEKETQKQKALVQGEKAKYEKLRTQYEEKLEDLKNRLTGL